MRSVRRIRLLRVALLTIAVLLLLTVAWEVWSHRPRRKSASASPPAAQPDNALQTLDKFEYTATEKGKLAYRILADKLVGVEGGLRTLQRIRSAEIMLSDGRTLRASADHGTFTEGPKDAKGGNGGRGRLVLDGHVTVTSDAGERLDSDRIEYSQAESTLVSPGTCRFRLVPPPAAPGAPPVAGIRRGIGPSDGEAGRATYELTTKIIRLQDGVVIHLSSEGAPPTQVAASQGNIAADGTTADFEGSARVTRGEEFLEAPSIRMLRSVDGDTTRVIAGPGARGRLVPASADARPTLFAAHTIDSLEIASTGERRVTLDGDASLEDAPIPGTGPGRSMVARTIVAREAGRAAGAARGARAPRTVHAEDEVRVTFPPAVGETLPRILTCRRLDAVTAPDGSLATADADGTVTVRSGARRSVSARAHMVGESHAELRGGRPVVEEPDRRVVADEIDVETKPSQLTARGSVQTRFVPASRGEPGAMGKSAAPDKSAGSGALPFTPGIPVDILSDTAVMKQDAKTAEFTGHVRARQADRALSSASLFVNDADKTARAQGSVTLRSFREETSPPSTTATPAANKALTTASPAPAPAPTAGAPAATTTGGPVVKVPIQVDADALFHDDVHKITRFEGHAIYREPGRRLSADTITLEGGAAGSPATTRAEGHVVYDGEGKRGAGDLAIHHAADKTVTLEGRERPAQVVETASGRSWRGPSLTWVQAPDSIPVVTGTSGRSRIVGSTSSQQRDDVGKPADRRKPR